jgi:UPF0042 nucleotide-binding protein
MKTLRTVIITGVSGAGKTSALRALEDLGFYCVDNLPLALLTELVELMQEEQGVDRVALVVDARLRKQIEDYAVAAVAMEQDGQHVEVVYLDAADDILVRRFSQTRRRHPLAATDLRAGLLEERQLLERLRAQASICLDTSEMTPHQLKGVIQDRFAFSPTELVLTLLSFGFRHGLPSHADVVLDVRFLSNPYFVDELRSQTGRDPAVARYVMQSEDAVQFADRSEEMLRFLMPRFHAEGKVYLTVAVGCTGGQHRSVTLVEELARRLRSDFTLNVRHRDLER